MMNAEKHMAFKLISQSPFWHNEIALYYQGFETHKKLITKHKLYTIISM